MKQFTVLSRVGDGLWSRVRAISRAICCLLAEADSLTSLLALVSVLGQLVLSGLNFHALIHLLDSSMDTDLLRELVFGGLLESWLHKLKLLHWPLDRGHHFPLLLQLVIWRHVVVLLYGNGVVLVELLLILTCGLEVSNLVGLHRVVVDKLLLLWHSGHVRLLNQRSVPTLTAWILLRQLSTALRLQI